MNLLLLNTALRKVFTSVLVAGGLLLFGAGCQTTPAGPSYSPLTEETSIPDDSIALREGDVVKIVFPSASTLNTSQSIRRDGKISLPVLGEIQAAGLTPTELEKQILTDFGAQLVTKEVSVTLESSVFPVFVNGAVVRPGKVVSNRPLTALEAIMESGGFDYTRANLKTVRVIRNEANEVKNFTLDFRGVLAGQKSEPFYLKPSDIIYVPEKFTLF